MKLLIPFLILLNSFLAISQEDCNCQTQIMRVEIQGSTISNVLNSNDKLKDIGLPSLQSYMDSDAFKKKFINEYPMEPMGFPFNKDICLKEKEQGDPKFQNVDCENTMLCGDPTVSADVKTEVCVALPCAMILGSQKMDQCPPQGVAKPTMLHFPEPIKLQKIAMTPTSLTSEDSTIRACFNMTELETSIAVGVEFGEDPAVAYERMGISNLNIKLDGPREVCMSGKLNLGSSEPLSEVKIEKNGEGHFVSNTMINQAISGSTISGVSGYSPATINVLKLTAAPALARHFRPTVEEAVQMTLAKTFQESISQMIGQIGNKGTANSISTPSNSIISEMGVANISVKKYVDLMDCALLKAEGTSFPAGHKCITQVFAAVKSKPLKAKQIPSPQKAAEILREQMGRYDQVTSENLKNQLLSFEERMQSPELNQIYQRQLRPLADRIANNQLQSHLINGVQLVSHLGSEDSMSGFGLSIPDICNVLNPSTHMGRNIPNCPIQAYVDLNEMNNLMKAMYDSGRLCHRGKGDFVPEVDSQGRQVYNKDDSPRGSGCFFAIEEDKDGMRCFLNGPPEIKFDSSTNGYKVSLKTQDCFRGGVFLGQGKIGGDINFEIGFTPSICGQGDFCLENGQADWSVVPGSARFALKESSWLNGIVRKTIDKQLNAIMSETIRLPLSSNSGPMSMVPLEAEGRIDAGPGFFGACLKVKESSSAQ